MKARHSFAQFTPGLLMLLPASLGACGGNSVGQASATSPGSTPAASPMGAPAAWSDKLSKDQKIAFMKANVAPRMRKVFQAADPRHYAEFGCKTCHGPNWQEPKAFLPKLTLKDGQISAFAEKPAVAQFMAERVVPEMAAVLGEAPYNPDTHQGFGCAGCHTLQPAP
jgi:hypothetical protein